MPAIEAHRLHSTATVRKQYICKEMYCVTYCLLRVRHEPKKKEDTEI